MEWGFIWIMFVLKIPLIALLWLVWWAVKQTDQPTGTGDDGGSPVPRHPRPAAPTHPRRRGPHGDPSAPPPARVRTTTARARSVHD